MHAADGWTREGNALTDPTGGPTRLVVDAPWCYRVGGVAVAQHLYLCGRHIVVAIDPQTAALPAPKTFTITATPGTPEADALRAAEQTLNDIWRIAR